MEMEILLGKSKTGKSRYIYNCIKKDIDEGIYDILFVPSQTRLTTEEEFMQELGLDGIIGVDITTISSFVLQQLKNNNLNFESSKLSKTDKKLLLAKTIIENSNIFNMFSKVSLKQGFLDNLYIYMDIFKKENINIKDFKEVKFSDKILEEKLIEILKIYEKYNETIKNKFINSIDEISLFIESNRENFNFKNRRIFFDGYNNFTNSELLFIDYLIKAGALITISIDSDISSIIDIESGNTQSIFEMSNKTYKKLLRICNQNNISVNNNLFYNNYSKSKESIKYLSQNLFSIDKSVSLKKADDSIHIYLKNDMYKEIRHIARDISKKIRAGSRYNDFVIYTTNTQEYQSILKRIFSEYNIPYYIDTKQKIEKSRLVEYIIKLLDICIKDINYESVLNILKLGLNDIDESKLAELDNYVCEFNLGKRSLSKELSYNNKSNHVYNLEMLNCLRNEIIKIFSIEKELITKNTTINIIKSIYDHLLKNNIFKNYDNLVNKVINIEGNNYFDSQVWEKICEIFSSINKVYFDEELEIKTFNQIFKIALSDCYIKSIPPSIDNVKVLDINVSKGRPTKYAYFVQVNEDKFPKNVNEDIFFSDFELDKLSNKNIEFKENSISRLNMGMYNIYTAISNVLEELNVFILASDTSGRSLRPSSLITLIKQQLDIDVVGDITSEDEEFDIYSKEQIFKELIVSCINGKINEKELSIYKIFNSIDKYREVLHYTKNDDNLSKESVEMLFGNSLTTSVSRLELYKKCPFSYFMQYSLNINPKVTYEITSLDTGTFMHDVLEQFSKYLLKNNIFYYHILKEDEDLKEEYLKKLYEVIDKELEFSLKKHQENIKFAILRQKLINTMKNVIIVIAKSFKQSDFEPLGYEIEFKDGSLFTPIEIKVSDNMYMKLIGKIDRVDILQAEDTSYIRVVDYKSSSRSLELDDIKEGISLQLMTYLTALIDNLKKENKQVIPAACVYFNLSDKLINLSDYTNSEDKIKAEIIKSLRLKGIFLKDISILERMDKKISDSTNRMLDISKISISKGSEKALDYKEFEELSLEIKDILKNIGSEMLEGTVKIRPNKKCDYCKYCKYINICRKTSNL